LHRTVLSQVARYKRVTGDSSESASASGRDQGTIDNGLYDGGESGTMTEVILHRVTERDKLTGPGIGYYRHAVLFEGMFDFHHVFPKEEETPVRKFFSGPWT
jgi:hypothetical protein